jgi:hypothetical protein
MANDALSTYLNDHLAGSATALQLLEHLTKTSGTAEEKQFLATLHADISEDRDVLEGLLEKAGSRESGMRQVGGWLAAKIGELKLAVDNPSGGTLDRFQALEILALGIHGKRALWRALDAAAKHLPEIQGLDLRRLEGRARDQHDRVEMRRLATAQIALQPKA